jgi:hypothetical protein
MAVLEYAVWGLAGFFSITWGLGLVLSKRNRMSSNIMTVLIWWGALGAALADGFYVLHLLWIFPAALLLPALLLGVRSVE